MFRYHFGVNLGVEHLLLVIRAMMKFVFISRIFLNIVFIVILVSYFTRIGVTGACLSGYISVCGNYGEECINCTGDGCVSGNCKCCPHSSTTTTPGTTTTTAGTTTTTVGGTTTSNNCFCACADLQTFLDKFMTSEFDNMTDEEAETQLAAKVQEIQNNLTVPTGDLSSTIRRKTSAADDRLSSRTIGVTLGIGLIAVILGTVVISDMRTFYQHISNRNDST